MREIEKFIRDCDNGLVTAKDTYNAINKVCWDNLQGSNDSSPDNIFQMFEAVLAVRGLD